MNVPSNKLGDLIRFYTKELALLYPVGEARSMIELLVAHYFSVTKLQLVVNPDLRLNETELLKLHFAVKELKKFKPVQYILNNCTFDGNNFFVDENVLIPRSETEELVGLCAAFLAMTDNKKVLDLGTGSGCIAISLAKRIPGAQVTAVDVSANALHIAEQNAIANNVVLQFIQADILNDNQFVTNTKFSLIVSNPPYVTISEKGLMRKNVLDYEPSSALFVPDDDPLVFYKRICVLANSMLAREGMLAFEINERFGEAVAGLLQLSDFNQITIHKDINKKDRFVTGLFPY